MAPQGRIRVVHVAGSLGLGGTEKAMQLLCLALDKKRFEVFVHALEDGPRREQLAKAGIEVSVGPDLLGRLSRIRPHIVHLHRAGWPQPALLRDVRLAAPEAVVETNVFGRFDPTPGARVVDRILFVSEFCRKRYGAHNDVDVNAPRYGVLGNPVQTGAFAACEPDFTRPVLCRVSRADPGKWSPLALKIIPLLAKRIPDFRYRIIGGTDEARRFVSEAGLDEFVQWRDPVSSDAELAAFLGSSSAMAHANDTGESFGMVIAEAMAAGLPVLTHPCPPPKDNAQCELVEHGVNGLVAGSAEEYAAAAAWLFRHPERARAMGRAGREKVRRLYDSAVVARRLKAVYLDLLADKPGAGYDLAHGRTSRSQRLHP